MLPDLPDLKMNIKRLLDRYLQKQIQARLGAFSDIPHNKVHEGNRMRIIRADGSIQDSDFFLSSAEIVLKMDEVPSLTIEQRLEKINEVADKMANQINKNLYTILHEATDSAGQSVNYQGKPFDVDAILAVIELIQIDFDETGRHMPLSLIIPPSLTSKAKQIIEQFESDPMLKKRYEEVIERKRMEWYDRETARKLVG